MEQQSPHGLVGFDLIEDYVHPTPRGQRLIARELWKALLEGGLLGAPRTADPGEFERAAGPERSREQLNKQAAEAAPADATRANNLLYNQALVLENQGLLEQAIRKNLECLQLAPNNYMARHNLARLYGQSTIEAVDATPERLHEDEELFAGTQEVEVVDVDL